MDSVSPVTDGYSVKGISCITVEHCSPWYQQSRNQRNIFLFESFWKS